MFQNILHLILTLLRIQIFFYKNFGNLQSGSKDSVFCKSIHRVEFKDMDFDFPWKRILLLLFLFVFVSCERSKNFGFQNRGDRPPTVEDLEAWKERLAMEEAEIVELERKFLQWLKRQDLQVLSVGKLPRVI